MANNIPYSHDPVIHNKTAARIILPLVFDLVNPSSVLDVGCGLGTWLSVCNELGIDDYLGLDGDFVPVEKMVIPSSKFLPVDLNEVVVLKRKFSLVICLEVAEHLRESSADSLVSSLVQHGEVILFSAAIPYQGGQNHLNEQWPQYWQKKFEFHGFYFHDIIRPIIWNDENVDWWYRQNIFLVTKESSNTLILNCYHPDCFKEHIHRLRKLNKSVRTGELGILESFKIFTRSISNYLFK